MLPPGLELQLPNVQNADPSSRFELPCVVQGVLRGGNRVDIGAFTGIYGGSIGLSRIGRFCSLAQECVISQDEHPTDWLSTSMLQYVPNVHDWHAAAARMGSQFNAPLQPFASNRGVTIGNDVWLGTRAIIRSGVNIGDGAIIAAGSVVVKNVAPYTIVGGNPARVIRQRFPDHTVERLTMLQWWNYDVFRIPTLDFSNIDRALDVVERAIAHGIVTVLAPHTITVAELMASP